MRDSKTLTSFKSRIVLQIVRKIASCDKTLLIGLSIYVSVTKATVRAVRDN